MGRIKTEMEAMESEVGNIKKRSCYLEESMEVRTITMDSSHLEMGNRKKFLGIRKENMGNL